MVFNPQIDQSFREKYNLHKAEEPYTEILTRKHYQNSDIRLAKQSMEKLSKLRPLLSDLEYRVHGEKTEYLGSFNETYLYKSIKSCKNSKDLATAIQILFWLLEERYDEISNEISKMVQGIRSISVLAPSVSFAIHQDRKQLIIYPHGEKFLDEGVINIVLSGLEKYPEVLKRFTKALQIY